MCTQIRLIDGRENISRRNRRRIFFPKEIANAAENVAAVVKRHNLHGPRERNARFEIQNRERITTHRYRERIQENYVVVLISKLTFGNHDLAWTSLFERETAQ